MIKDKRDNGKSERNETLKSILNNYKGDRKRALKEHPDLETLYDLSDLRENLLEWYPFREGTRLLQVGSGYGALTGVYSEKAAQVDVLDPDAGDLEVNELRQKQYEGRENIRYIQDELCHYVESGAYVQNQMAQDDEAEPGKVEPAEVLDGAEAVSYTHLQTAGSWSVILGPLIIRRKAG